MRTGNSMSENDFAAGAAGGTAATDVNGGLEKVESNPDDDWSPEPHSCSSSPVSEDQRSAKRKREDETLVPDSDEDSSFDGEDDKLYKRSKTGGSVTEDAAAGRQEDGECASQAIADSKDNTGDIFTGGLYQIYLLASRGLSANAPSAASVSLIPHPPSTCGDPGNEASPAMHDINFGLIACATYAGRADKQTADLEAELLDTSAEVGRLQIKLKRVEADGDRMGRWWLEERGRLRQEKAANVALSGKLKEMEKISAENTKAMALAATEHVESARQSKAYAEERTARLQAEAAKGGAEVERDDFKRKYEEEKKAREAAERGGKYAEKAKQDLQERLRAINNLIPGDIREYSK